MFLQPVESKAVPVEVALMKMMSQPPICSNIIQFIDWFDEPDWYILILELPNPFTDLESFHDLYGCRVSKETARVIDAPGSGGSKTVPQAEESAEGRFDICRGLH